MIYVHKSENMFAFYFHSWHFYASISPLHQQQTIKSKSRRLEVKQRPNSAGYEKHCWGYMHCLECLYLQCIVWNVFICSALFGMSLFTVHCSACSVLHKMDFTHLIYIICLKLELTSQPCFFSLSISSHFFSLSV